jgi:hypothetical protein
MSGSPATPKLAQELPSGMFIANWDKSFTWVYSDEMFDGSYGYSDSSSSIVSSGSSASTYANSYKTSGSSSID